MTRVEEKLRGNLRPDELTLFSSLEPCPMCLTRLIISGVANVYHGAADEPGGMVSRLASLPPEWKYLAEGRGFGTADCSENVRDLGWRVFEATVNVNDSKLKQRAKALKTAKA